MVIVCESDIVKVIVTGAEKIMNNSPETLGAFNGVPIFMIMSCNTVEELSRKVSEALKDGSMYLHGHPFVFKDQICQSLKFLSHG
jgi:hypothetical protein